MADNTYHFITHWRVFGTLDEVRAIIGDVEGLTRWWPSVYLGVKVLAAGDEQGVGRIVDLYTKGWLPYTLRWKFEVTEVTPTTITLRAQGDFDGRGQWTFAADGDWTNVTYDWNIAANKPLLKRLTPVLRPVFSANHHWAMAMGERSLQLEIARRRAATPEERRLIPAPPPPTPSAPLAIVAGVVAIGVVGWRALWSAFRLRPKSG